MRIRAQVLKLKHAFCDMRAYLCSNLSNGKNEDGNIASEQFVILKVL